MSTIVLHAFPGAIAVGLRAGGHRVVEVADDDSADHRWHDLVTARGLNPRPLEAAGLALLAVLLRDAATIFDLYARHFHLNQADYSDFRGLLELHLRFALDLLRSERPDALAFATIPHEGYDLVLFLVARHLGIRCLVCYQTPFPDRFWVMENGWDFRALDAAPAAGELRCAGALPQVDLFYMRGSVGVRSYRLLQALRDSLTRPLAAPAFLFRWQRAAIYRHRLRRRRGPMPDNRRAFVYFPLHLQPELTTSVLGGVFADQILALECLREMLPEDVQIVVKENPYQTELHRGRVFFERLSRIPGTTLLDASASTAVLTADCVAVATVSGTAGWEGLLAGKPVFLFGTAWYEGFNGVHRVDAPQPRRIPPGPVRDRLAEEFSRRMSRAFEGVVDEDYVPIATGYQPLLNAEKVGRVLLSLIGRPQCEC